MFAWNPSASHSCKRVLFAVMWMTVMLPVSAAAAWRIEQPSGDVGGVRLSSSEQGTLPDTWAVCEPGDTLRFLVTGAERIRVQARAVLDPSPRSDRIRYTVAQGHHKPTRYARRLPDAAGTWTLVHVGGAPPRTPGGEVTLSAANVLTRDLDHGTDLVRLWPHDASAGPILFRVLVNDGIESATALGAMAAPFAASHRFGGVARVATGGYESNPYLTPRAVGVGAGTTFWPGELALTYRGRLRRGFTLAGRFETEAKLFSSKLLDESSRKLEIAQDMRLRAWGGIRVKLEERYSAKNSTFFGRGDSEEFSTSSDSVAVVSLADRFDRQDVRLRGRVELSPTDAVALDARLWWLRRDYREDYEQYLDIDAIDYTRWAGSMRLTFSVNQDWSVYGKWSRGRKTYREKFARDASGATVERVATRYRFQAADLGLSRESGVGWQFDAGFERETTDDVFEGYWDAVSTGWSTETGWRWGGGSSVHAGMRRTGTDYLNAHLGYDEAEPLKSKSSFQYRLESEIPLSKMWSWWLDFEGNEHHNNNELFAYDETTSMSGLEFRF